jgi:methylisocitrate lyase
MSEFAVRLRRHIVDGTVLHAAGVWDGLSARIARSAGYQAMFLSGAALSASRGLPDAELITAEDVLATTREIVRVSSAALLVDLDTGFGDAVTLHHVVQDAVRAGAAAVMIEDQAAPKVGAIEPGRPPHLAPLFEVVARITAACDAASGRIAVVVRSDAGPEEMVDRLLAYGDAGADVLFPLVLDDRLPLASWREIHERSGLPLACTLAPGSPVERTMDDRTAASVGVALVVHSLHGLLAAFTALESTYGSLRRGEAAHEISSRSVAYRRVQEMVGGDEVRALRAHLQEGARDISSDHSNP